MMNIVQLQEQLKDFSKGQLVNAMKRPTGEVPQYLVLSELQRRKRMESSNMAQQGAADNTTVAEDAIAAAGVPQGGLAGMARAMAPKTDMARDTGQGQMPQAPVQAMAEGGDVDAGRSTVVGGRAYTMMPDGIVLNARTGEGVDEFTADAVRQRLNPEFERGDVFDPAQPVLRQVGIGEFTLDPVRPQGISAVAERALSDLGVNPSYETDMRDRAVGVGISDRAMMPPREDAAPRRTLLDATLPQSTPALVVPEPDPYEVAAGPIFNLGSSAKPGPERRGYVPPAMGATELDIPAVRSALLAAKSPAPTPGPERRGYVPPAMGATELNIPAVRSALRGEPTAGFATGLRDAAESAEPSDVWSGVLDDINNTAAILSPFASEEDTWAAAGNLGPSLPEAIQSAEDAAGTGGAGGAGGTAAGTGGAGGAGGPAAGSPAGAMTDLEKSLEQDKWMALAQFGLALMSSNKPTMGQAIGEAGLGAIASLKKAKQDFEEAKLAREALAVRRAAASKSGSAPKKIPSSLMTAMGKRLADIDAELVGLGEPTSSWFGGTKDPDASKRMRLTAERAAVVQNLNAAGMSYGLAPMYAMTGANPQIDASE